MRALVSRSGPRSRGLLLPSSVVCAALIFGPVGAAVAVTDASRDAYARVGADTTWSSSAYADSNSTYADRVLRRLGALERADRSDVLTPVLNVLTGLTEQTGSGRMTAPQAAGFAKAVETANASLKQRLADRIGTSNRAATVRAAALADPISDLLDQLSATLAGLLDTVTGLVGGLLDTVTGLLGGLLDTLGNLLGGLLGGLPPLPVELPPLEVPPLELPPAAAVPALPALPAVPAVPALPAAGGAADTVR